MTTSKEDDMTEVLGDATISELDGGLAGDDAELAQRFREGDEDAVRDVYRRYAGAMYMTARWLLRDDAQAADAVQQAFLQAWRSAASFDTSRPLSPWLFQITRRVCVDAIRRARRRPRTTKLGEVELGSVDDTDEVERSWIRWEVRRAIGELLPPERDVARLAYVDGLSHREIAGRLGLPMGTVKSRTSRAQAKLAGALTHLSPTASEPPAKHPNSEGSLRNAGQHLAEGLSRRDVQLAVARRLVALPCERT